MPNNSFDANKMEPELAPNNEGHSDLSVLDLVSDILLKFIRDLHVFKSIYEEKHVNDTTKTANNTKKEHLDEDCPSQRQNNTCVHLPEDFISVHNKSLEKDIVTEKNEDTTNSLEHNVISDETQDILNRNISDNNTQEDINSCGKEILLSALNLSPALIDLNKESNDHTNFAGKCKESVHFPSPVAIVYEFSEKSEVLSDCSTEILSDSESEVLFLSQDKYTETCELELGSGDASSKATYHLNKLQDGNVPLYVKDKCPEDSRDVIMTAGGDNCNFKLSTNNGTVINPLNSESISYYNHTTPRPQDITELFIDHKKSSQKEEMENRDKVTLSENFKSGIDRPGTNNAFENSKEMYNLEEIAPNIDTNERKISENENYTEVNCVVGDLLPLENESEKKNICFSDVFTKYSLDTKENNIEHLPDMFIDLSKSNTIKNNIVVKAEDYSSQNMNSNDHTQASDISPLNKTEEQGLFTQTSCKITQEDSDKNFKNNAKLCESKDEIKELSKQYDESNKLDIDVDICSKSEKSDTTENMLFGQKREQSSPELNCCQVSKRSKSEISFGLNTQTKKRKLFKVEFDENKNVKLAKLDFNHCQSNANKAPKMLKQLASDVLAGFEETVIFETKHTKKQEGVHETHLDQHGETISGTQTLNVTRDINSSCEYEMKGDSPAILERQDEISEDEICLGKCDNELQQEGHKILALCTSESKKNSTLDSKLNLSDTESYHLETSEVGPSKEDFPECPIIPEDTEVISPQASVEVDPDNCERCVTPQIASDQNVPIVHVNESTNIVDTEITASTLLHTDEEVHFKEELIHVNENTCRLESPKFVTATELLSQSSQESGSTGFTVNAADFQYRDDSQEEVSSDKSEVIQKFTVADLVTENSFIGIDCVEQGSDHGTVSGLNHSQKNMLEITENGLREELLENADFDVVSSSEVQRNAKLFDCTEKSCAATDQDEQIDTGKGYTS